MLVAHLVPGYFAADASARRWQTDWNRMQRMGLWTAALVSTFVPDLDVIYNIVFRHFANHTTLWTHSLLMHLGITLGWFLLVLNGRWPYVRTLIGLIAVGGLSHLLLDVIAHSTPLFYPFSLRMVGFVPRRVVEGGLWAYLSDPVFLLEPLLITVALLHWITNHIYQPGVKRALLLAVSVGCGAFMVAFLVFLPTLQRLAHLYIAGS